MEILNIKKHGEKNHTYFGELANNKIMVVFENDCIPVEGNIKVLRGKLVTKNSQNYYYISSYEVVS